METFTDTYLGLEIHVQVFSVSSGEADISCRIVDPSELRLAPLTAEVMRVPGGSFPHAAAARIGVAYCMGIIDCYRDEDDERTLH
ncbi:hypothetical protein ACFSHT_16095 [Paraburkholderia silviterrae]|uniref:Uncharacterized protein n=1 Tax=Paraburkholderia silviterrae TaxID=2528715 RepID=A0A4V2ZZ13_9BURK|nr:hypothetical protein [Paraburkholderia silviterrae]TDG23188.1 hypothetical protein EYW47_14730 [Paraburkholderia silviterrae]